jgi:hypothetical protein
MDIVDGTSFKSNIPAMLNEMDPTNIQNANWKRNLGFAPRTEEDDSEVDMK